MDSQERIEYIKTKLKEKGIDQETQDYVLKYVDMNQQLFGNILDMDRVTERIVNNLQHNISGYDILNKPLQGLLKLFNIRGSWGLYSHRIEINPVNKLLGKISRRVKEKNDSTVMHELDHCATTEYVEITKFFNISEQEIEKSAKRLGAEKRLKYIKEKMKDQVAMSGVASAVLKSSDRKNGINRLNLALLNEGITAYKQEIYNNFLGIKSKTGYKTEKSVAYFISEIIGKDKLVYMHANNDYNAMRVAFQEKTGQDLNKLVRKLNLGSLAMTMMFGPIYTSYNVKKLQKYMQTIITTHVQSEPEKGFVPRYEVDHTAAIEKAMEKSQNQTHTRTSEIESK